jgi:hypothetical protein
MKAANLEPKYEVLSNVEKDEAGTRGLLGKLEPNNTGLCIGKGWYYYLPTNNLVGRLSWLARELECNRELFGDHFQSMMLHGSLLVHSGEGSLINSSKIVFVYNQ